MPNQGHPPLVKGATPHEQGVVNRAYHLADLLPDRRMVGQLREVVELAIELIETRNQRRDFLELYDRPHED